jgi:hypothetical protein
MLPRADALPQTAASMQTSIDSKLAELRREIRGDDTTGARAMPTRDPAPSLRREPGLSLRDSILKKPLSSLYDKD